MTELKFITPGLQPAGQADSRPAWITGEIVTAEGAVPVIATGITAADHWEHIKCRASAFRNNYRVKPGLYAVGRPDRNSAVLAGANYKLSFDALREAAAGLDAWILVLDTKGINVWCAAGKGTFGTGELVRQLSGAKLDRLVDHRRIIVPQLGAPGISAREVKRASGFTVCYGPVRAEDIRAYIAAGYQATREMRTITFPLPDRLVLTPMEINPALKQYYPWYALAVLISFGLQPEGLLFREALTGGLPFLLLGFVAILAGALVTPALLPFIPFRSFAVKGWLTGLLLVFAAIKTIPLFSQVNSVLIFFAYLFFPLASSYIALQFTGATTFTGMSGVAKELKFALPLYSAGALGSVLLLLLYKLNEWRLL